MAWKDCNCNCFDVFYGLSSLSNLCAQALLEQGSGEARIAELEAQIEDLMAEAEVQAEESLAKDEEIDLLEAQLAAAKQACSLNPLCCLHSNDLSTLLDGCHNLIWDCKTGW